MTYRQGFDRLGNPVARPRIDWQRRIIVCAGALTLLAVLAAVFWGR